MTMNNPTLPSLRCQAHWQNAQSQRYNQILPKSLPAHPTQLHKQKDNAAKIKDRLTDDKNGQLVTACIVHLADSANIEGVTSNKLCSDLTVLRFESPNDTIHANRWRALKRKKCESPLCL